jgi:hypothetical protein
MEMDVTRMLQPKKNWRRNHKMHESSLFLGPFEIMLRRHQTGWDFGIVVHRHFGWFSLFSVNYVRHKFYLFFPTHLLWLKQIARGVRGEDFKILPSGKQSKEIVRLKLQGRKNRQIATALNLPVTEVSKTLSTVADRIRTQTDVLKLRTELGLRTTTKSRMHITKPAAPDRSISLPRSHKGVTAKEAGAC